MKTLLLFLILLPSLALSSDCIKVSEALAVVITGESGKKITFHHDTATAVLSSEHYNLYFIGIHTSPDGLGIWATNHLTPGKGMIFALNKIARNTTVWPTPNRQTTGIGMKGPGIKELRQCMDVKASR